MTVKNLIEFLNTQNPDTPVLVNGYESNYTSIKKIEALQVFKQINTPWWDGEYVKTDAPGGTFAIALLRGSAAV